VRLLLKELHTRGSERDSITVQRDWLLAELDAANQELARVQAERDGKEATLTIAEKLVPLHSAINRLKPDEMSPMECMTELIKLKRLAGAS
jgi:hypothetical protein